MLLSIRGDRCTTVAEFDDDVIEGLTRRAKDENGKSILVPQDMNYKEWYEKNVTNTNKNVIIEKIPNNIKDFYNYISKNNKLENLTTFKRNEVDGVVRGKELNKILGYDKLPTIVSKEEFDKLAEQSNIGKLYRGVQAETKEMGIKYVNDFKYGQLYAGKGVYGNGIYVAYRK